MANQQTKILIINQAEVARLLPMSDCIGVMETALGALARGAAVQPLRSTTLTADGAGLLALMPAQLTAPPAFGFKAVTVFNGNAARGLDSHYAVVLLLEADTGRPLALLNGAAITAIRTAAVSAVATKLLARDDARTLAILGSGVQARAHLEAMLCVRPLERVRIWSRNYEHARACAEEMSCRHGLPVTPVATAEQAVRAADILVAVTAAEAPIVSGEWLAPGAHVNAVGAHRPTAREFDTQAVAQAKLVVDARESALNEAGDILIPIRAGAFTLAHIHATLGEIINGDRPARVSPAEITFFKSLGLAVEDVAAAHFVQQRATAEGCGLQVSF